MQDYVSFSEDYSCFKHDSETIPKNTHQKKRKINPSEAKNIPKNIGGLLKNHFVNRCSLQIKDNKIIKSFISLQSKKKSYSREDIQKVLEDREAAYIAKQYFASFEIIEDVLQSEKLSDTNTLLKYIRKFFVAAHFPKTLSTLKLPE